FTVKDMSCNHCVQSITRAVKQVDAEGTCDVDLGAKRVRIGSRHSADEFRAAIENAGFTPEAAAR
ncbi:MAG TPA: heavy-metal-associated domain-containing protein, partial [Usitatibacter sp.]|nr:heavy-metal-associated domain-containing protein [Usitatibacter sp.]